MDMTGSYDIPAPRQQVWEALNNPEVLKKSIPGCQSFEKLSDSDMRATVVMKIGPVKATFRGKVALSDIEVARGYRITGEGEGGVAGFAKGGAVVRLEDIPGGTRLTYEASADVGGKIAQLGARLIDGAAKKLADEFFESFSASFGAPMAQAAAPQPTETKSEQSAGSAEPSEKRGFWRRLFG